MNSGLAEPASFRDPSGFVFRDAEGQLYRQVNRSYEAEYRRLIESGLYRDLCDAGLLVEHEEVSLTRRLTDEAYKVIRPLPIGFISYPYEWSFGEIREAALLTLDIQKRALAAGMTLKDCSAYNVQFVGVKPVFIDTLSFERYEEGAPWVGYRQFCEHFLAPLVLMSKVNISLGRLLRVHLDGIPLDVASAMLPWRTCWRPGLLLHVALHARLQRKHASTSRPSAGKQRRVSPLGLRGMIDSLERTVAGLSWRPPKSAWSQYYADNSYTNEALEQKKRVVADYLARIKPRTVWDLGANTGLFSRIASGAGAQTIAFDLDPACVEINFLTCRKQNEPNLLPLCLDLTNPSPGIGWAHQERRSLMDRGPADAVLALALIHHLGIARNIPLAHIAEFFSRLCRYLIVEFVPKDDPQTARLLRHRKDVFADYAEERFRATFGERFATVDSTSLKDSGRTVYLMEAKR